MLCKESQSSQLMKSQSLLQVWQRPSTSMSLAWAFVPCTGARGRNQLEITPGNVGCSPRSCKVKFCVGNANGLSQFFFFGSQDAGIFEVPRQHLSFFLVSETWELEIVQEIILYQLGKDRQENAWNLGPLLRYQLPWFSGWILGVAFWKNCITGIFDRTFFGNMYAYTRLIYVYRSYLRYIYTV